MAVNPARLDVRKEAELQCDLLTSSDLLSAIKVLKDIIQTSYGPQGRLKSIQNCSGGHLTLTSTSLRLFGALSVSKPLLKLVLGSVQSHINMFRDGGLFTAFLSLTLIDTSLHLSLQRHIIVDLFHYILDMVVEYLYSPDCVCKASVSGPKLDRLLKLAKSVAGTKPLCSLHNRRLDDLSKLLTEAFLKSLPENSKQTCRPENVHFVMECGFPVSESKLFEGVLLDTCGRDTSCVKFKNSTVNSEDNEARSIPVVVVNISMSGDLEDFIEADGYDVNAEVNVDHLSKKKLESFAEALVKSGAKAVFCQKVVHPEMKMYFKKQGVLVVDRLGGAVCKTVEQITGAVVISCISSSLHGSCVGSLASITVEEFHEKSYLLLKSVFTQDVTVVLCNSQEEMTAELKCVSEAAIQSLYLHLEKPDLLCGAGCWQTHTAHYIRQQVQKTGEVIMDKFRVSKYQLVEVTEAFCHSLELCAIALSKEGECHMTDTVNHHLWKGPSASWNSETATDLFEKCSCGMFSKGETTLLKPLTAAASSLHQTIQSDCSVDAEKCTDLPSTWCPDSVEVLDSLPVLLNALQIAVLTTGAVLNINQYIKDTN